MSSQSKKLLKQIKDQRYKCRTDLYYLCKEVLGYEDLAGMHAELCKWDAKTRNSTKRLILLPRGHFKSSVITIGVAIQEILRTHGIGSTGTEECIAIGSGDRDTAESFLKLIKEHFERNERLKMLFPDVLWETPRSESKSVGFTWRDSAIQVKRRKVRKEGTVEAFSIMSLPTGKHFERIIVDDAVDEDNSATAELKRKVSDKVALLNPLKVQLSDPLTYIGTHYAHDDAYSTMRKLRESQLAQGLEPDVEIYVRPAIETDEDGNEYTIFPERFTIDDIRREIRNDPYIGGCQYMLDPSTSSRDAFDPTDIQYYKGQPDQKLNIVLSCDPARTTGKNSDYTAIVVMGFSKTGRIYLLDGVRDRMKTAQIGTQIIRMRNKWKPELVAIEENGLEQFLRPAMESAGLFDWHAFRSKGNKEDRIRKLLPFIARRKLFLPSQSAHTKRIDSDGKPYDLTEEFITALFEFPHASHDDLLDAAQATLGLVGNALPDDVDDEWEDCVTAEQRAQWEMRNMDLVYERELNRESSVDNDSDEMFFGLYG